MSKLIINGMATPYWGEIEEGTEVWGINRTFHVEPRLTRLYFFDHPRHFPEKYSKPVFKDAYEADLVPTDEKFVDQAEALHKTGVRVISAEKSWFDGCEIFDLDGLVEHFNGIIFYTSSVAYLIAQAIKEGFTDIEISGAYHPKNSMEYLHHMPCVNFWFGIALGMGINIRAVGASVIASPLPWESPIYGYQTNKARLPPLAGVAAAYRFATEFPRAYEDYEGNAITHDEASHE